MSFEKEMLRLFSTAAEGESQLTRYDSDIVHCRLDDSIIAESPYFITTSKRDINNAIDGIYCAANAGLEIGKALLHRAAFLQYSDMDSIVRQAENNSGEANTFEPESTKDIHDSLALLDASLAEIKIAIEEARKSQSEQGS